MCHYRRAGRTRRADPRRRSVWLREARPSAGSANRMEGRSRPRLCVCCQEQQSAASSLGAKEFPGLPVPDLAIQMFIAASGRAERDAKWDAAGRRAPPVLRRSRVRRVNRAEVPCRSERRTPPKACGGRACASPNASVRSRLRAAMRASAQLPRIMRVTPWRSRHSDSGLRCAAAMACST